MTFQYGSERDVYKAYFYAQNGYQIVVVLVNTLTGEQTAWYLYNLWAANDSFVGICLVNAFDRNDQRYLYDAYRWSSGTYAFAEMTAASVYDE
jgi:hypothetical protein